MSSDVARYLRQLKLDELLGAAKRNGVKVKETWPKPKIVEILSTVVSQKDVTDFLSKRGRAGVFATIDGMIFEKKALKYFTRKGWHCELDDVRVKGMEFDIVGQMKAGTIFKKTSWVLAECKNKPKVIMQDFDKFLGKLTHFIRTHGNDQCEGYLIASGVFDPLVKRTAKSHPEIRLLRLK